MHTGLALSIIAVLLAYICFLWGGTAAAAAAAAAVPAAPAAPALPFSDIELFVSEQCGHCAAMKPEILKLQTEAQKQGVSVRVITPEDADAEVMMQSRHVQYFPAIFVKGKPFEASRTAEGILKQLQT